MLADLLFAVDRSYMLDGQLDDRPVPAIQLSELSFGALRMANGLTRLETRFLGDDESVGNARKLIGQNLEAQDAMDAGLITYAPDDIDWEDEIRLLLEERASFSPDCRSGNDRNQDLRPPECVAELDISTSERRRRSGRIKALWHGQTCQV
jgi:benzoyl-CoA-dihydrodiol lyase